MNSTYTPEQLLIIQKIAQIQIADLLALQEHPEILQERVEESRAKGFDEVTISDYYEDILEAWGIWERILEKPESFLQQRFIHNYEHMKHVMENSYQPTEEELPHYESLIKKLVIASSFYKN